MSHPQQELNLSRVSERIQGLIMSFARDRVVTQRCAFHMTELTSFVSRHHVIAPDSAGRVLRLLRKRGQLDYVVLQRSLSLYEITKVAA